MEVSLIVAAAAVFAVLMLTSVIVTTFLRSVEAGEIFSRAAGATSTSTVARARR